VKEFLQVFGGFTIADAVVFIIAIGFIITTYFKLKKYIEIQYQGKQDKIEDNKKMKEELKRVGEEVDKYPQYRQQSINIQEELKANDAKLLETCVKIQQGVDRNQELLNERLDKLEDREKNSLKAKILDMHRLFTSKKKNPMQARIREQRLNGSLTLRSLRKLIFPPNILSILLSVRRSLTQVLCLSSANSRAHVLSKKRFAIKTV
jgi:hypothetical protein